MQPVFQQLSEKYLVGFHQSMSHSENKTFELWNRFMRRRQEIKNNLTNDLFSLQIYDASYSFSSFDPNAVFEKWAAVEVQDFENVPEDMSTLVLPGGLYAVFIHKGPASDGYKTFGYIFGTWLPASGYELDDRPHFEILGARYKNNEPDSEEEVWIPVKAK